MKKLDLSDVTLCAADSVNMGVTARSLRLSMAQCDFADSVFFTHEAVEGEFRTHRISRLNSSGEYSAFILKQLPILIGTEFVLVTQWDGYVLDASAFLPEFRDYDYIGAKWYWHHDGRNVGNGGFSLRSQKLLRALVLPRFPVIPNVGEDDLICRFFRPVLEAEFGIKFAPEAIADRFSYERSLPSAPSFGFHGLFNMWRHVEDAEMIALVDALHPYVYRGQDYLELMAQYFLLRKFGPFKAMYGKLRPRFPQTEIIEMTADAVRNPGLAQEVVQCGEGLFAPN